MSASCENNNDLATQLRVLNDKRVIAETEKNEKALVAKAEKNKNKIEEKLNKYEQVEFFALPRFGFSAKSDLYSLEFPFFSLSKKKDTKDFKLEYTNSKGKKILIEIRATSKGRATIWDKEILIYIIGKLMSVTQTEKYKISRTVRIDVKNMLKETYRSTGGDSYLRLIDTLDRLKESTIKTNLKSDDLIGCESIGSFSFISEYLIVKRDYKKKKGKEIERAITLDVTLPHWIMLIVDECEVLTLNSDYFKLKGGIEKRMYEIGKKHLGNQRKPFSIKYENLYLKLGSLNGIKPLFKQLNTLSKVMSLPDIYFVCDDKKGVVTFDHKMYKI